MEAYREGHGVGVRPHVTGLGGGLVGAEGSDCAGDGHEGAVDDLVGVFGVVLGAQKQSSRG